MSTALVPAKQKIATFRQLLVANREQIAQALPRHIEADKMLRVVMTSLQKTPKLLDCDQGSILGSVIEASQLGLMLDGVLGEAYLVPYKGRCQMIPGYKGLVSLARRSGEVSDVYAELVFTCDVFKVTYGLNKTLEHEPNLEHEDYWKVDAAGDMPSLKGAYAVVVFKDGTRNFVYMPRKRLEQIKGTSKSVNSDYSPWNTATGAPEMYRKCPIRQLAKMLPLSPEFQRAAALDELAEVGIHQGTEFNIDPDSEAARMATASKTDQIAAKYSRRPEDESQEIQESDAPPGWVEEDPSTAPEMNAQTPVPTTEQVYLDPEQQSQPSTRSGQSRRKPDVQGVPLSFDRR